MATYTCKDLLRLDVMEGFPPQKNIKHRNSEVFRPGCPTDIHNLHNYIVGGFNPFEKY